MIFDTISNLKTYQFFSPGVQELVNGFISGLSMETPLGETQIMGNRIYANVEEYTSKVLSESRVEAHHKYLDIQLLLSGGENIYYGSTAGLETLENYDKNRDIEFFKFEGANYSRLALRPGYFMVILPGEGHMPAVAVAEAPAKVRKVVIKISGELL